jgi:hypothetical protein
MSSSLVSDMVGCLCSTGSECKEKGATYIVHGYCERMGSTCGEGQHYNNTTTQTRLGMGKVSGVAVCVGADKDQVCTHLLALKRLLIVKTQSAPLWTRISTHITLS